MIHDDRVQAARGFLASEVTLYFTHYSPAFRGRGARLPRFAGISQLPLWSGARYRARAARSVPRLRASSLPRGDGRAWRPRFRRAPARDSTSSRAWFHYVLHGECRESDAESNALTEEFASEALLASKLREVVDGAVETILGSRREEGGFKDMLVSSLISDLRGGASGPDLRAAELESEIAAAKRTRMREAELKRKLGI